MSDPSLDIQKAIVIALRAACGPIVFDRVPVNNPFPRITIGEGQCIADLADCYDGSESFVEIHIWSQQVGFPEAKAISSQVRLALNNQILPLDTHEMELMQFQSSQILRDPDGITNHIAMTFRVLSQPLSQEDLAADPDAPWLNLGDNPLFLGV